MSNDRIREITGVQPVDEFVRFSRWKWLGHVCRKQGIVRDTPGWVDLGRRSMDRPRETWVRTMRREAGMNVGKKELAQDRMWLCEFIEALCIPVSATGKYLID